MFPVALEQASTYWLAQTVPPACLQREALFDCYSVLRHAFPLGHEVLLPCPPPLFL